MSIIENFSVRSTEFIQDPYPIYKQLRDFDPIHLNKDGYYFLTRYEDVKNALTDLRLLNAPHIYSPLNKRNNDTNLAARVSNNLISFLDSPNHNIPRKIISNALQESIKDFSDEANLIAKKIIYELKKGQTINFDEAFSIPFATSCIAKIVGLDKSLINNLHHWSEMFFLMFHNIQDKETLTKINTSVKEFREAIKFELERSKKDHSRNLMTILLDTKYEGDELDVEVTIDNIMLLIADAIGNVHTGLTSAVSLILRHENEKQKLQRNPELLSNAILECIRYDSPAQYQGRVAGETIELGGKKIRKNSILLLSLGSANRDPKFIQDPDRFDIQRQKINSLSFGLGRHRCIGFNLVLIELSAAISSLFIDNDSVSIRDHRIEYIARAGHRWPKFLLVEF